jgi:hypothetical protein
MRIWVFLYRLILFLFQLVIPSTIANLMIIPSHQCHLNNILIKIISLRPTLSSTHIFKLQMCHLSKVWYISIIRFYFAIVVLIQFYYRSSWSYLSITIILNFIQSYSTPSLCVTCTILSKCYHTLFSSVMLHYSILLRIYSHKSFLNHIHYL